jgi:hypothetical protein
MVVTSKSLVAVPTPRETSSHRQQSEESSAAIVRRTTHDSTNDFVERKHKRI